MGPRNLVSVTNVYEGLDERLTDLAVDLTETEKTSVLQKQGDIVSSENQRGVHYTSSSFDWENIDEKYKNTILIIRQSRDLGGAQIILPKGSEIKEEGGRLSNCTIIGNKSTVSDTLNPIFGDDVNIDGTWYVGTSRPQWFGGLNGVDDFKAITLAGEMLRETGGNISLISGDWFTSKEIKLPLYVGISGAGSMSTNLYSIIPALDELNTKKDHIVSLLGNNTASDSSRVIYGIKFIDDRPNDEKNYGYAIYNEGVLNVDIKNCEFINLGGGAIKTVRQSHLNVYSIYAFGCGKRVEFRNNDVDIENGIIHIDRKNTFSNTMSLNECYISNCSYNTGIYAATHAIRLNGCSVESCHTLLRIGDSLTTSRSITVNGLYLENARTNGIVLQNVSGVTFNNTYFNDSGDDTEYSHKFTNCRNVKFNSCDLGVNPFSVEGPMSNIQFDENCRGVLPPQGISGFNDKHFIKHNEFNSLGVGLAKNLIANSEDIAAWQGNAVITKENNFLEGKVSNLVTKTVGSHDTYYSIFKAFNTGSKCCFSFWLRGKATAKIRARRSSDGTYVDIVNNAFSNNHSSEWKRYYISAEATEDFNLYLLRITPETYSVASASCEVAKVQFQDNAIEPGAYIKTGPQKAENTAFVSINEPFYLNGNFIDFGATPPTTGTYNVGDTRINNTATIGEYRKFVCVESGTPGTWGQTELIEAISV
ncbi:hypothetical protein [Cochleicola gelatinilyticus]|uniref:Right handed beta helix domain-containing protein n=1 Tax=Cochleicola gelatinilyticus TaxID=1763537 RepID=A0A167IKR3_9FLAO|nr:hypothetical protein [Cochleicola gelatinilyticus]OAB79750.1 hypothetical protein ULVI_03115 [Cochleicola gelatinilyticus]